MPPTTENMPVTTQPTESASLSSPLRLVRRLSVDHLEAAGSRGFVDGLVHRKTVPDAILAQVVTGQYEIECVAGRAIIEPGELFLIAPNTPMTITHRFNRAPSMEAQWVHFRIMLDSSVDVTSLLDMPLRVTGDAARICGCAITNLRRSEELRPEAGDTCATLLRSAKCASTAYDLLAAVLGISACKPGAGASIVNAGRFAPVVAFIRQNLTSPIHVEELAGIACLSVSHFHAGFKEAFGEPPMDFVRSMRLKAAARMLSSTDASIENVADAVGYASPFHFSRLFKRETGVSPSEYRKMNRPFVV